MNNYSLPEYKIDDPSTCVLPYPTDQYFSEGELSIIEDEYFLDKCHNKISDAEFNDKFKILSVMDKKNLVVNIYFSYRSKLHKITSNMITDLSNDNIIYTKISSNKIKLKIYD